MAARLVKNGITAKDLQQNYDKGFEAGYKAAAMPVVKSIYAGCCLVLHRKLKFGAKRCGDFLRELDQTLLEMLSGEDAVDEVFHKIHLKMNFNEPFERIEDE